VEGGAEGEELGEGRVMQYPCIATTGSRDADLRKEGLWLGLPESAAMADAIPVQCALS